MDSRPDLSYDRKVPGNKFIVRVNYFLRFAADILVLSSDSGGWYQFIILLQGFIAGFLGTKRRFLRIIIY